MIQKLLLAVACGAPLVFLLGQLLLGQFVDPVEACLNRLGFWALIFLLLTLACTPAKVLVKLTWPLKARRTLGLTAFFYASLHVLTYAGIDQGLALADIGADIAKRPFISVGLGAFGMLVPLATTSTRRMVRRLGYRRWQLLHRLIYPAAALGVVHYFWRVKADVRWPLACAAILAGLLAVRGGVWVADWRRWRSKSIKR